MIYFIGTNNGLVYIGRGSDKYPYRRAIYYMNKYDMDSTIEFRVVGTMNGNEEVLGQIQDVFKDFHSHRNWYKNTAFVSKSIENLIKS